MPAPALTDLVARCRRHASAARAEPDANLIRRFARTSPMPVMRVMRA